MEIIKSLSFHAPQGRYKLRHLTEPKQAEKPKPEPKPEPAPLPIIEPEPESEIVLEQFDDWEAAMDALDAAVSKQEEIKANQNLKR